MFKLLSNKYENLAFMSSSIVQLTPSTCPYTNVRGVDLIWSPNYPNNYGNKEDCTWVLKVPEGTHIMLTPDTFDILGYDGYPCYDYDALRIYDLIDGREELIGEYCNIVNPLSSSILSKGNGLKVHFTTNWKGTAKGFQFKYSAAEPGNHFIKW